MDLEVWLDASLCTERVWKPSRIIGNNFDEKKGVFLETRIEKVVKKRSEYE